MSTTKYRNISGHAESLDSGAVVGVGEFIELSDETAKDAPEGTISEVEANKDLLEQSFIKVEEPKEDPPETFTRSELLATIKENKIPPPEGHKLTDLRDDELLTLINNHNDNKEGSGS